jgi:hypothetical protein
MVKSCIETIEFDKDLPAFGTTIMDGLETKFLAWVVNVVLNRLEKSRMNLPDPPFDGEPDNDKKLDSDKEDEVKKYNELKEIHDENIKRYTKIFNIIFCNYQEIIGSVIDMLKQFLQEASDTNLIEIESEGEIDLEIKQSDIVKYAKAKYEDKKRFETTSENESKLEEDVLKYAEREKDDAENYYKKIKAVYERVFNIVHEENNHLSLLHATFVH